MTRRTGKWRGGTGCGKRRETSVQRPRIIKPRPRIIKPRGEAGKRLPSHVLTLAQTEQTVLPDAVWVWRNGGGELRGIFSGLRSTLLHVLGQF